MKHASFNRRCAALHVAVLLTAACTAPKARIEGPPPPPPPLDASYDWHVLLIAPFGSVLKDVPLAMHEVLLFRDTETAVSSADDAECYATEGASPRFLARAASQYLLCFKHDRLSRIEAVVRLRKNDTDRVLADACGLWTKNALAPGVEACEGLDGGVSFTARLERPSDDAESQLTVSLSAADLASDTAGRSSER